MRKVVTESAGPGSVKTKGFLSSGTLLGNGVTPQVAQPDEPWAQWARTRVIDRSTIRSHR